MYTFLVSADLAPRTEKTCARNIYGSPLEEAKLSETVVQPPGLDSLSILTLPS